MSVDFGIFANTDFSNSPFQYVIFGKNGGLLEVELNEAQYLGFIRDKIALESIGNRCVNASISRASNGTTTIKGDIIIDGYAIHSCDTTISTSVGDNIYVGVSLETLTKDSTVTKNGKVGGEVIDNTILDKRMGIETTQRKAIKLELSTTAQDGYVKLAHIASTGTAMFDLDNLSISDAIKESKDVEEALNNALETKANKTELDTHTGNDNIHITASERTKWNNVDNKLDKSVFNKQIGNHTVKSDVPENAVFTDTVYDDTDIKEEFTKAIDDIEIGGRNLLFDTETMKSWAKGDFLSVEYNQTDYLYKNNAVKLTNTKSDGSYGFVWFQQSKFNDLANRVGKRTFSIWAKTEDPSLGGYLILCYRISANTLREKKFYLSTEWGRYTFSYDVTEDLVNGNQDFIYLDVIGTSPIYICYPKLENGNKATDWTPAPEDTEAEIQSVDNKLTTNLLKPTLVTTIQNGVTCTNNGDGTYTFNGTASANAEFLVYGSSNIVELNKEFRLTGCPKNTDAYLFVGDWENPWTLYGMDTGDGSNFKITTSSPDKRVGIGVPKGKTVDNVVFKPMITTNLNATYDDFVPYTGDSGKLNSDVSELWDNKAPKVSPEFQNDISMNRLDGKTVGDKSTALGSNVTASGDYSHAEGYNTIASGDGSHVEGTNTEARGNSSHAEGLGTVANAHQQSVQGRFNVIDTSNTYAHIVGGGTGDTKRKNIYTLDWDGNAVYAGDVKATDGSNEISLTDTAKHLISIAFTSANIIKSGANTSSALSNVAFNLLFEEAYENACLAYGNIIFTVGTGSTFNFGKGDKVYVRVQKDTYNALVSKYLAMASKSFSESKLAFAKESMGTATSIGKVVGVVTLTGNSTYIQVLMTFLESFSLNPTTVGGVNKQVVLCF